MNEPTHSLHHECPDADSPRDQRQADADMQRAQRQVGTATLPKRYWRLDEVADYFAISTRTVYRLLDEGALQTIQIRSCRRVALEEIRRFEEKLMNEELF
ncbi:MAG: helix-turn-helix domain-containing protein [Smithellaceae bacterium]|nr:helix-turn-helix domain-containing protein [Smithellaceae bacterium]